MVGSPTSWRARTIELLRHNVMMHTLTSKLLARAGAPHAFTSRRGGCSQGPYTSLNLGLHTKDDRANVLANRERALADMGTPNATLITVKQVHGADVVEVTHGAGRSIEADGLWTRDPLAAVGVLVADCVPVLIAHLSGTAVAAVHAGWRGTAARIVGAAIARLEQAGFPPGELYVAIGPSIGPERFEVGEDAYHPLADAFPGAARAFRAVGPSKWCVDLWALNREAALAAGVVPDHIEIAGVCTYSSADYYSHRRDDGITGRQAGIIAPKGRA